MRLDVELVNRKLFSSRQKAKEAVVEGMIKINSAICKKPSYDVKPEDKISVSENRLSFVGRGGLKLEKIADKHGLYFDGKNCMDIGASTGGFTDCMLRRGAEFVYAVDVGSDQLDERLRSDKRVCNMEKTDVRNISVGDIDKKIDFISIDVSFISLKLILPKAFELLADGGMAAVLVKPQFEAGKQNVGKKGIVKSQKIHEKVLFDIADITMSLGFGIIDMDHSPIRGGSGNIEYLMLLKRGKIDFSADIKNIVKEAFEKLKSGGEA